MKTRVKRPNPFPFSDSNKRYHTYDYYLRHKYGKKCVTVPLDGGFSCPNIDGTISYGGCTFCSARGSGDFCAPSRLTLAEQFEVAKRLTADKWGRDVGYIPYFQAFSATHGDFDHMRTQMETAAALPGAVALHLATRPDCLPPKVVHYLASLAARCDLVVELGLQSIHDETLRTIRRGHTFATFLEGYQALRACGVDVCIHLINGLPGETKEMMLETSRVIATLQPAFVKIHSLYILHGTEMAEQYQSGKIALLTREEYVDITCRQLEYLPSQTVIARVMGDAAADQLIAPLWCQKKFLVLNEIDKWFVSHDSMQGMQFHTTTPRTEIGGGETIERTSFNATDD